MVISYVQEQESFVVYLPFNVNTHMNASRRFAKHETDISLKVTAKSNHINLISRIIVKSSKSWGFKTFNHFVCFDSEKIMKDFSTMIATIK